MRKILYMTAQLISNIGDGMQQIALYWYIYSLTGSPLSIGIMIAIYYLPSMGLSPFAGALSDLIHPKRLTIIVNFFRGIAVFILALVIWFEVSSLYFLYLFQLIMAILYTIYKPASQRFIKHTFYRKEIPSIMALSNSLEQVGYILGTGFAGYLITIIPASITIGLNGISFMLTGLLFHYISLVANPEKTVNHQSYRSMIAEGIQYIKSKPDLKWLLLISVVGSFGLQLTITVLPALANQLGGSGSFYAILDITFTAGGIAAGLILGIILKKQPKGVFFCTVAGMMGTSIVISINNNAAIAVLMLFLFGIFVTGHLIVSHTYIQLSSSHDMIGRVIGVRTILASAVKVTSSLLTGLFAANFGVHFIFHIFTSLLLIALVTLFLRKRFQKQLAL
ncbi:MAG: MFS transporter [Bacillaceae bacterium]|nr:MFS transporter [Bacillaceae bacterium]